MRTLFILVLLSASMSASAQHWLWKVSVPESTVAPSYVFAVLHTAEPSFQTEFNKVEPYFESCAAFAPVWPLDALSKNMLIGEMQQDDRKGLKRFLGKDQYETINKLTGKRLGDDLLSYNSWQPLYLRRILMDAAGRSDKGKYWEDALYQKAKASGKAVRQLISPALIGRSLAGIPLEEQAQMLYRYADRAGTYDQALQAATNKYLQGDFNGYRESYQSVHGIAYTQQMVDQLRLSIAESIASIASQSSTFFIAEAPHFGNGTNLITALNNLGLVVEPVSLSGFLSSVNPIPFADAISSDPLDTQPATEIEAEKEIDITTAGESLYTQPVFQTDNLFENAAAQALPAFDHAVLDPFGDQWNVSPQDTVAMSRWFKYRSNAADFTARFPIRPDISDKKFQAGNGILEVTTVSLRDPNTLLYFFVSRTAYPQNFPIPDRREFFDNAMKGSINQFNGRLIKQRAVSTPAYTGRSFLLELRDGQFLRSTLMLSENRLYQNLIVGSRSQVWSNQAEYFLRSLRISGGNTKAWTTVLKDRFRFQMPLNPISGNRTVETPSGPVNVDVWTLEDPLSTINYFVSASYYPKSAIRGGNAFLDQIISSTVTGLGGQLMSDNAIKTDGIKGREILVRTLYNTYRIRFYVQQNTLYQVMVNARHEKMSSADPVFYLNSFTIY